jgi:hypothetical protein
MALELSDIALIASGLWWVDLEGKLRVKDWFAFELAQDAVRAFHEEGRFPFRETLLMSGLGGG